MGVKVKTVKNEFPKMKARLEDLDGNGVEVGVLKGEHAWLAAIHEYGCDIKITPRMRKFLHWKGLHVKDSTTEIKIPERSFLRGGFDANEGKLVKKAELLLGEVIDGRMSADGCFEALGSDFRDRIRDYLVELDKPANHEYTLEHKNTSNPLIRTGNMLDGITWRKVK